MSGFLGAGVTELCGVMSVLERQRQEDQELEGCLRYK